MSNVLTLDFAINVAAQEVLGTALTIIALHLINNAWKNHRFGGWTVKVIKPNGDLGTIRPIGIKKAEEILDDLTTMSVFLKGLASPYGWLVIDLVTEGLEMGVLSIDKSQKTIFVDLSVDGCVKPSKK